MNLSLSRFTKAFLRILKDSPLSFVLLAGVYFLILNGVWDRGVFESYENWEEATALASVMGVFGVVLITSINASVSEIRGPKTPILFLLLVGLGFWRRSIAPIPNPGEIIQMFVIGLVCVLGSVAIVLLGTERKDSSVHTWILHLIEQAVIARLFTILMAGGVSLAFMAVRGLFDVNIDPEWFLTVRATSALFLGGVSLIDGVLSGEKEIISQGQVHKRKRMLSRVLGFLLLVFGIILYVYMAKILVSRNRPSNEVSFWAFLYSGIVIASSIILLPIWQDDHEHMYTIRRRMYLSILPMCVMIAVAIFQRIQQYGITMERYLVIAFLLRLSSVSILMVFQKRFRLWWLFASLMSVGVFSIFAWPLDAKSISYKNQMQRAKIILESKGMLTENGLQLPLELSQDDAREVSGVLTYITYSLRGDLQDVDQRLTGTPREIFDQLGIEVVSQRSGFLPGGGIVHQIDTDNWRSFSNYGSTTGGSIEGYTTLHKGLFAFNAGEDQEGNNVFMSGSVLDIKVGGVEYQVDLKEYIQELLLLPEDDRKGMVEPQNLSFEDDTVKLLINNISLSEKDSVWGIQNIDFDVLVR